MRPGHSFAEHGSACCAARLACSIQVSLLHLAVLLVAAALLLRAVSSRRWPRCRSRRCYVPGPRLLQLFGLLLVLQQGGGRGGCRGSDQKRTEAHPEHQPGAPGEPQRGRLGGNATLRRPSPLLPRPLSSSSADLSHQGLGGSNARTLVLTPLVLPCPKTSPLQYTSAAQPPPRPQLHALNMHAAPGPASTGLCATDASHCMLSSNARRTFFLLRFSRFLAVRASSAAVRSACRFSNSSRSFIASHSSSRRSRRSCSRRRDCGWEAGLGVGTGPDAQYAGGAG